MLQTMQRNPGFGLQPPPPPRVRALPNPRFGLDLVPGGCFPCWRLWGSLAAKRRSHILDPGRLWRGCSPPSRDMLDTTLREHPHRWRRRSPLPTMPTRPRLPLSWGFQAGTDATHQRDERAGTLRGPYPGPRRTSREFTFHTEIGDYDALRRRANKVDALNLLPMSGQPKPPPTNSTKPDRIHIVFATTP